MDDNRMLTLASNERIPLTASMRLLLEINHMNHCSPATVSRGGVIFVNADDIGWKPVVESWVERLECAEYRAPLNMLFRCVQAGVHGQPEHAAGTHTAPCGICSKYVERTLDHCRRNFHTAVPLPAINQVQTLCKVRVACLAAPRRLLPSMAVGGWEGRRAGGARLTGTMPLCQILEGVLPKEQPRGAPPPDKKLLEHHFVFACVWAFGGCLAADKVVDHRLHFSRWFTSEFRSVPFPPEARGLACRASRAAGLAGASGCGVW